MKPKKLTAFPDAECQIYDLSDGEYQFRFWSDGVEIRGDMFTTEEAAAEDWNRAADILNMTKRRDEIAKELYHFKMGIMDDMFDKVYGGYDGRWHLEMASRLQRIIDMVEDTED